MESLIKQCNICWGWLGGPKHAHHFSKITNCQYLWERLSYFVYLLHVVTRPWKLQCYVVFVRHAQSSLK